MTIVVSVAQNNSASSPVVQIRPPHPVATSPAVTLRNDALSASTRRIDALLDVVADGANTAAGSTLVYDPDQDKYIVKQLDLDGGTF